MIKKIKGIVVKEIAYKDTSKIIEVLTNDGLYSIVAKGSKRVSSPLFLGTTFLSYSEFCIYASDKISTLKSVDLINGFKNTLKDIVKLGASSYLVNLCMQVYKQNNSNEIYDLLLLGISKIDSGINPLGIVNIIEIKLLKYLGLKLHLDKCVICGGDEVKSLSLDYSGYLCKNCSKVSTDRKILKLIKLYDTVDLNKLDSFNVSLDILLKLDRFIEEYYSKYTGLYLESKNFFKSMLG